MEQRAHAMAAMSEAEATFAAYASGDISAEIALMRLVLAFGSLATTMRYVEQAEHAELLAVAEAHRNGLARVAALVEAGLTRERTGSIAAIRNQFDAAVRLAPEAAVALYSLGSRETLDRMAAELVDRLREWRLLGPEIAVLDIGCGIGRIARALAPYVGRITGVDVSPAMVAEAERRSRDLANVDFSLCAGSDLAPFAGRRFGLIVAVDVFPYLVAAGPEIAARHIEDAAGLLDPGGALAIFNYSYRRDLAADRAGVIDLAARHGFAVERDGSRDFALWDGATFLLRKSLTARGRRG